MIRGLDQSSAQPVVVRRALPPRAWIWACVLLILLTWTPVLAIHLRNMSVSDPGTGTVIVVFPPTSSTRDMFRSIVDARGTPVAPVSWVPRAWIVQSAEAGFAGRLREHGAWGVYYGNLLSVRQILSCSGMVQAPPSPAPAEPPRPAC
jgi:hypothetical protein